MFGSPLSCSFQIALRTLRDNIIITYLSPICSLRYQPFIKHIAYTGGSVKRDTSGRNLARNIAGRISYSRRGGKRHRLTFGRRCLIIIIVGNCIALQHHLGRKGHIAFHIYRSIPVGIPLRPRCCGSSRFTVFQRSKPAMFPAFKLIRSTRWGYRHACGRFRTIINHLIVSVGQCASGCRVDGEFNRTNSALMIRSIGL